MNQPRISVIIVLYNALAEARKCLEGLAAGNEDLETVVVDNASTEPGLEGLAADFPTIRLIRNRANLGFAKAVNQAARLATGRYLLLLNPDCLVPPGAPQKLADRLAGDFRAGIAGPRLINPDGSLQTSAYAFPSLIQTAAHLSGFKRFLPLAALRRLAPAGLGRFIGQVDRHQEARPVDYLTGAALMIKRQVWEALEGLDERFFLYYEEIDFCLRARRAGWQTWFDPTVEIFHAIGASSETVKRIATLARYRSLADYFAKHRPNRTGLVRLLIQTGAAWRHGLAGLGDNRAEAALWREVFGQAGDPDRVKAVPWNPKVGQ